MTGKFRRSFASTALIAAMLGLTGCQSTSILGLGGPEGPSKAAMVAEERKRNMRLAAAAQSAGQYEVALGIYSNLLRLDPAAGDIRSALGEIYFAQGAYEKSLAAFDQALNSVMPNEAASADAHVGRGRARLATGDAISAERDFVAALAIVEADALAINGLGVAADMQGRHGVAQTRYREALALDPGNERVRSNLGLSLALAARFDDAIAQLAPLATTSEAAQKARYNLALTFGLMGRPSEARELVAAALAPAAADDNGLFYAATRDAVRAEAVRASAVRSSNDSSDNLTPHRRLPRLVINEDLTSEPPAAPVAPLKDAEPVAVKPPPAKLPTVEPMDVEPAPVAVAPKASTQAEMPSDDADIALDVEPTPVAAAPKASTQAEMPSDTAEVALNVEPETPAAQEAELKPSAAMEAPKTVKPTVADAPSAVKRSEQLAMASPRRSLMVDVEHLDKNDAFYEAMRVVVDEVNKPTTPWGGPMPVSGVDDQIASN